mmetsp:Transcript_60670/g.157751  ORF Transcript_60670/g.157751 Transcript_60670/m.157751 type:complete len:415 (+) Transcript_60670:87-1331(+)
MAVSPHLRPWLLLLLAASVTSMQLPKFEDSGTSSNFQGELVLDLAPDPDESVMHSADGPSFCVIARVTTADLPYMESFLRHYSRLGVNTIYLFNDGLLEAKHADVVQYLQALRMTPSTTVKLLSFKEVKHDDPVGTADLLPLLKEDYVINVDADEFWILPKNISSLPNLLREHPADIYFMRWVMVVDDDMQSAIEAPYEGTVGFPGKWMANLSMIPRDVYPRPFGHHTVPLRLEYMHPVVYGDFTYGIPIPMQTWSVLGRPLPPAGAFEPGYMAHFWGRSFSDVFLKIALRGEGQCQPLSEYNTQIDQRLATLAFLSLNKKMPVKVDVNEDMFKPDLELELKLAVKAACEKDEATALASLRQFHENYLKFKQDLSELMDQGSYPNMWPSTALTQSLMGTSVTDWLHSLPLNITA